MKLHSLFIAVFTGLLALLLACQTKPTDTSQQDVDTVITLDNPTAEDSAAIDGGPIDMPCVRSQAEPVLKKEKFPDAVFRLNDDNHSGTESALLPSGDKLIITNGGCEYYVLTFRFETSRFQHDTTDLKFWGAKMVAWMTELDGSLDAPIAVSKGTAVLKQYLQTHKPELYQDIEFEPGEIRSYITLDRVQQMDAQRFAVELSYLLGPL